MVLAHTEDQAEAWADRKAKALKMLDKLTAFFKDAEIDVAEAYLMPLRSLAAGA